jgi:hypothetical protein
VACGAHRFDRGATAFFAKWSKLLASFLDWFRQPIRL